MIFNSVNYAIFLAGVLLVYYILPYKIRYIWLLVTSYYFYMQSGAVYALLLFSVTFITFFGSLAVYKADLFGKIKVKRFLLFVQIIACFGLLIYFKYANFILQNISFLINIFLPASKEFSTLDIILPVGISFFTFQSIGYSIDVYRGDIHPEKNYFKYALFLSFFPQLVAGPIERSKNLLCQLTEKHTLDGNNLREGMFYILFGVWQKVLIADNIASVIDPVFSNPTWYHGIQVLLANVLFAFQIYCDFGGYSNIAIGSAKLFGIKLMKNFDSPYLAESVTSFWRRWHISLTIWFRDYLYIPLGGNRKGKARKLLNTFIVFFVSGAWHGASWGYIFWGTLNGIYIIMEDLLKNPCNRKCAAQSHQISTYTGIWWKRIFCFLLVDFSWLFFRVGSFQKGWDILFYSISNLNIRSVFSGEFLNFIGNNNLVIIMLVSLFVLFVFDQINEEHGSISKFFFGLPEWNRWIIYLFLVISIILYGAYGDGYEQTQFIYFQF